VPWQRQRRLPSFLNRYILYPPGLPSFIFPKGLLHILNHTSWEAERLMDFSDLGSYAVFLFHVLFSYGRSRLKAGGRNRLECPCVVCKCIPLRETTDLSSRPVMSGSVGNVLLLAGISKTL
jgi:hypothetical protein